MKNGLCSISAIDDIFMYADDTTLLVPQHTDVELDVDSGQLSSDQLLAASLIGRNAVT